MPINISQLPAILAANTAANAKPNEALLEMQKGNQAERQERLKSFLQRQAETTRQQQGLSMLQKLKGDNADLLNNGGSVKVDPATGEISAGGNPYARMGMQDKKGEAQAISQAQHTYTSGLPKIQTSINAAQEGLEAINDEKNPMSKGEFLGAVTRAYGLSRFPNAEEAKQLLPPSMQGHYLGILNFAGDDNSPLQGAQRVAGNALFQNVLVQAKIQHETLKQTALGSAMSSPFATQTTAGRLQSLGAPMDAQIDSTTKKYAQLPASSGASLGSQQPPGLLDNIKSTPSRLGSFFSGLGGGKQAPAQAAPAAPPGGQVDPNEFQNFYNNVYKKMKNAPSPKPPAAGQ